MKPLRILGVILAGGQANRMGGQNKALISIGQNTCFERVSDVFTQGPLEKICVSYNGAISKSDRLGHFPPLYDLPILGTSSSAAWAIYSTLTWARQRHFDAVITSPVDVPFLPRSYVPDLITAYAQSPEACIVCSTQARLHGLNALWPLSKFDRLETLVRGQSVFQLKRLHRELGSVSVKYDASAFDPFLNVNTPEDIRLANHISDLQNL